MGEGDFLALKNVFKGVGAFFILREGGRGEGVESIWRTFQNWLCSLVSTLKNSNVYLFFHFLNLARLYSCIIQIVLSCVFIIM